MTKLEMKTFDLALSDRARELAHCLAERSRKAIDRPEDDFENARLAAGRESAVQALLEIVRLLREVEAARDRLRAGAFGVCARCEDVIAPNRLQAIPWAAYCLPCQAQAEDLGTFGKALARAA